MSAQPRAQQRHAGVPIGCDGSKLIQYLADENGERICALAWLEGSRVRLASPAFRAEFASVDPTIYLRILPNAVDRLVAFRTSMGWLDMIAPAAASLDELQRTCEQFPEHRLRCVDYDETDQRLLQLVCLIDSSGLAASMPNVVVRQALLLMLGVIVDELDLYIKTRLRPTPHCGNDLALLELKPDRIVMVTFGATGDDVLRQGLTAHARIPREPSSWTRSLLVMPDLDIHQPIFVTTRVTVANLSREAITAALLHLARS